MKLIGRPGDDIPRRPRWRRPKDGEVRVERAQCPRCGAGVGELWVGGNPVLFDGEVRSDPAGRLVVALHQCVFGAGI